MKINLNNSGSRCFLRSTQRPRQQARCSRMCTVFVRRNNGLPGITRCADGVHSCAGQGGKKEGLPLIAAPRPYAQGRGRAPEALPGAVFVFAPHAACALMLSSASAARRSMLGWRVHGNRPDSQVRGRGKHPRRDRGCKNRAQNKSPRHGGFFALTHLRMAGRGP